MAELQSTELQELAAIARRAANEAAEILRSMQHANLEVDHSGDGPVTAADIAANEAILTRLQQDVGTQAFAYLTEETYKQQADRPRDPQIPTWVIDPLDGTKDFIKGTEEFALHIALVVDHRPVLAVVACPAIATLYSAIVHQGAIAQSADGEARSLTVSARDRVAEMPVVMTGSHRNPRFNQLLQQFPCQIQTATGSVGYKVSRLVEQKADVYLSLSGTSAPKDWDMAAPELILTEAGGQFTHFDGSLLSYNQADVSQWGGLMATNGTQHAFLCESALQILAEIDAANQ